MRILYVEDNRDDVELTQRVLRRNAPQFKIEIARSCKEALTYLDDHSADFDLVLSDMQLPDGDGLFILSHIRDHDLPLAVVIITGLGDEEMAVNALKSGADDYVPKHMDYLDHLSLILENAWTRYQATQNRRAQTMHVLYAEHSLTDGDITRRHLKEFAPYIHLDIVSYQQLVLERIRDFVYDVILLDFHLPGMNALEIIKQLLQQPEFDLPVVLVTGSGDEKIAIEALKLGAVDYLVKNPGYLYKLPSVLENAYTRAELARKQIALAKSEEKYRLIVENANEGILQLDANNRTVYANQKMAEIIGYPIDELINQPPLLYIDKDGKSLFTDFFNGDRKGVRGQFDFRLYRTDGNFFDLLISVAPVYKANTEYDGLIALVTDISDRKKAEEDVQRQLKRLEALRAIDIAITSSLDLHETLNILLDRLISQLNVDAACIMLLDKESQTLEIGAQKGFREKNIPDLHLQLGKDYAGYVGKERKSLCVLNIMECADRFPVPSLFEEEGFVSIVAYPLIAKGELKGVLEALNRSELSVNEDWFRFAEALAGQAAIAIDNAMLFTDLQLTNTELETAYDATIEGWARALDLRDKETEGHTRRVTEMAYILGQQMGLDNNELLQIKRGALLHDIGKMGIPDDILQKPGSLTEEEWDIMRQHPVYAYQMLRPIEYLRNAWDIPYCHHEKWDGSGYPRGLIGEQIPLAARIFAVIDVWDALCSDRPYRPAWSEVEALKYINEQSERNFDPSVVDNFNKAYQKGWLKGRK
jgi:PAS domain S-box-containing protein